MLEYLKRLAITGAVIKVFFPTHGLMDLGEAVVCIALAFVALETTDAVQNYRKVDTSD